MKSGLLFLLNCPPFWKEKTYKTFRCKVIGMGRISRIGGSEYLFLHLLFFQQKVKKVYWLYSARSAIGGLPYHDGTAECRRGWGDCLQEQGGCGVWAQNKSR